MSEKLIFVIIFSGVWTLVGIIFFIIGIAMINSNKKNKINCTAVTYGKVIDMVKRISVDSSGNYGVRKSAWHPVFEYNIGDHKIVKEYNYGNTKIYEKGQNIEVHYNPENYDEYYIEGDNLPQKTAKNFTITGICSIIIALVCAVIIIMFS